MEAGIKHFFFKKKLNTSLSVHKILNNNALTPDPFHHDNYIQTSRYIHKGVELDMTGDITAAIVTSANLVREKKDKLKK